MAKCFRLDYITEDETQINPLGVYNSKQLTQLGARLRAIAEGKLFHIVSVTEINTNDVILQIKDGIVYDVSGKIPPSIKKEVWDYLM